LQDFHAAIQLSTQFKTNYGNDSSESEKIRLPVSGLYLISIGLLWLNAIRIHLKIMDQYFGWTWIGNIVQFIAEGYHPAHFSGHQ